MLDRKKHRQEVESLRADVKRKEMVYIEKRDSSLRLSGLGASCAPQVLRRASSESGLREDGTPTVSSKLSAVSKVLKWILAIAFLLLASVVLVRARH